MALAATDPANPYGAALPWPERVADDAGDGRPATGPAARPARWSCWSTATLALYVERGGRTLLTFTDDADAPRARRSTRSPPPYARARWAG